MNWFTELLFGSGVPHIVFVLAAVIAFGILLGRIKIAGVSIGITWILFVGIAASHFGMGIDSRVLGFVKEFGLILFIYSIGMQVGPGFFSSFRKGGLRLNLFAVLIVVAGVAVTYAVHVFSGTPLTTMVGVMSGAVTNTPGLGAAGQAYMDAAGGQDPTIALGYAVAYPLGVIGVILTMIVLRLVFRINPAQESERVENERSHDPYATDSMSVNLLNPGLFGKKLSDIRKLIDLPFVISRIMRADGTVELANAQSVVGDGDTVYVVASAHNFDSIAAFLGERVNISPDDWKESGSRLVSRRIIITRPSFNGRHLGELKLRSKFGVNVTRVNRSGVDLVASPSLQLQMGDRLTTVGTEMAVADVARLLGNSMKRLREPNLISIFVGIILGVLLGSIPFAFPGVPQPVRLGLAGGPLIVAILISRFGPRYHLVTYTTMSANLMLREIGISLFLAAVGLGAGEGFVDTLVSQGGYRWIGYGALITVLPVLLGGIAAMRWGKLDYFQTIGLVSGATTNPPALKFASTVSPNDVPSVSYSTVYPLTMFLRVLSAQLLVLFAV